LIWRLLTVFFYQGNHNVAKVSVDDQMQQGLERAREW
jgi:hypothetical protein